MFFVNCRIFLVVALPFILGACQPAWRSQFTDGTRLFDRTGHHFFGRVINYEPAHDFHNGTPPEAAVLIEQESDHTQVWGSCATCAATFDLQSP